MLIFLIIFNNFGKALHRLCLSFPVISHLLSMCTLREKWQFKCIYVRKTNKSDRHSINKLPYTAVLRKYYLNVQSGLLSSLPYTAVLRKYYLNVQSGLLSSLAYTAGIV